MTTSPLSALCELSAVDLARAIRAGETTPIEAVDAYIAAILRWNPVINAVVANRFDDARDDAKLKTHALSGDRSALPPLFGVPCTVKENFGVRGMPHTAGSLRRKGKRATRSATVVERVERAGAVVLGVTNLPEMAFGTETDNLVYGRTNNPHDVTRTCGGSSGGEGAALAAGISAFGLASDVGGSIRFPSSFCGVFGHKPTGGMVPGTGHVPWPTGAASRFTVYGPMSKYARDLFPLLRIMAGPDGEDAGCTPFLLGEPNTVTIKGLRVISIVDDERHLASPDVSRAQAQTTLALEARGARVVRMALPELRDAFEIWGDTLGKSNTRTLENILVDGADAGVSLLRESLQILRHKGQHTSPALVLTALERLGKHLPIVKGGEEKGLALRSRVYQLLDGGAVLLFPAYPSVAPKHGGMMRQPRGFAWSGVWNILEVCSTTVPVARGEANMPIGMQVIAAPGFDHVSIAVAEALEQDFGGWMRPVFPASV